MYTARQKPASVYIHLNLYMIKLLVLCVHVPEVTRVTNVSLLYLQHHNSWKTITNNVFDLSWIDLNRFETHQNNNKDSSMSWSSVWEYLTTALICFLHLHAVQFFLIDSERNLRASFLSHMCFLLFYICLDPANHVGKLPKITHSGFREHTHAQTHKLRVVRRMWIYSFLWFFRHLYMIHSQFYWTLNCLVTKDRNHLKAKLSYTHICAKFRIKLWI